MCYKGSFSQMRIYFQVTYDLALGIFVYILINAHICSLVNQDILLIITSFSVSAQLCFFISDRELSCLTPPK